MKSAIKHNDGTYYVNIGGMVLRTTDGIHFLSGKDTPYFDADFNGTGIEQEFDYNEFFAEMRKLITGQGNLCNRAESFAKKAHHGQVDKAGKDYFENHVKKVADAVFEHEKNLIYTTVAFLHDILEDTETTEEQLRAAFPPEVVDAVVVLTKKDEESYEDYILRVKQNPIARHVKLYDLANNCDLSRIENPTEKDEKRTLKYANAYSILMS